MSGPIWTLVLGAVNATAYLAVAVFVVFALRRRGRALTNVPALATAAIFLTCSAQHVAMVWTTFRGWDESGGPMPRGGVEIAALVASAAAALFYLATRRSNTLMAPRPVMFDDLGEAWYRQLAINVPNSVVFVVDTDMRFVICEGESLTEQGYDPRKIEGRLLRDVVPLDVLTELEPYYRGALDGKETQFDSVSHLTNRTYRSRTRTLRDGSGAIAGALVLAEDVTDERDASAELDRARSFRDAVLSASPDITVVTDVRTGRATWSSRSLRSMLDGQVVTELSPWPGTGRAANGAIESGDAPVLEEDVDLVDAAIREAASLPDGRSVAHRYRVLGSEGEVRWICRRSTPFRRLPTGDVVEILSVLSEVTDTVDAERALERAALRDPLTGLPNRMLLLSRISSAIDRGERTGTTPAVLFCDLDGFERVNDTGGHAAGDAVLVEVARRLRAMLREEDSLARVGGDEFVVVIDAVPVQANTGLRHGPAELLAERIRAVLAIPIEHRGHRYVVSASIGMVLARRGGTAQDALRDADSAMHRAKQRGKDRVEQFDDALRVGALERAYIERTLRDALDSEREGASVLGVHYQPIYRLGTGSPVGFEALARLTDAAGAGIAPDRFVPVAEDTGLIHAVGNYVLDDALSMLARWRAARPQKKLETVAVNVSARQVEHVDFADTVTDALTRHGLLPTDVILELTESVLLESGSRALAQLGELRDAGVVISIDDFGTGYASLRYLATLPVSAVKIDRSFTATMTTDPTSGSIVRAIIALARDLNLECVVEGIETDDQLAALPGDVLGQGYLLGRPASQPSANWGFDGKRTGASVSARVMPEP
ncbi:MAG: EAL domain-containing protein [Rhodococcus sp. (in: high G+C Gram-positive bacteria)]